MKPCGPWVLIEPDPPERVTKSGLYLPQGNLEERKGVLSATVVSTGSGKLDRKGNRIPVPLSAGDRILFRGFLQELWRPDGSTGKVCLINIDDVLGTVEE
jgi:co-chaperonin GroES (HSP10)